MFSSFKIISGNVFISQLLLSQLVESPIRRDAFSDDFVEIVRTFVK